MEQLNLFDFPKYKIKNKIRLIELFAGIGSQAMALRNIGANFESWRVCEFDKYAIASYNAIFGTNYAPSDIQKLHAEDLGIIDRDNYTYLMTYSFPCTDLSIAGKMAGMKKNSGTRSGLLWEVERLLIESKQNLPQVLLMENVPQVITADGFNEWLDFLKSKGYNNFYKILNAKNYGVAQNRERCFMISILSSDFQEYEFPKPKALNKTVQDYLEKHVDKKYYIRNEKAKKLISELVQNNRTTEQQNNRTTEQQNNRTTEQQNNAPLTSRQEAQENCLLPLVSHQDMTREFVNTNSKELAYMNLKRIDKRNCKVAATLCARDYKGFGTGFNTMNGVIEWQ